MPTYQLKHITTYSGTEPISVGHNQAWLQPRELSYQHCQFFELIIKPRPSVRSSRQDAFGNTLHTFSFNEGYRELQVIAQSRVQVSPRFTQLPQTRDWRAIRADVGARKTAADWDALQFCCESPLVPQLPEFEQYAATSFADGRPLLTALLDLNQRLHREFRFDPQTTTISTPVQQVFRQRSGVCQDFAHLMIAMLRTMGLPARYVSGYIRTYPKPGQPRLVGADASHAWVSVYAGNEVGWIDVDPTNNLVVADEHVTVAWGRDYSDVPPLRGVFLGGGQPHLRVSVDMEPISDKPS